MANKSHALDFYLELSKERIPGHTGINKFGYNLDVDIATLPETIWSYGGQVPFPSSFSALSISSSSTNDTSGSGGGAAGYTGANSFGSAVSTPVVQGFNGGSTPTANDIVQRVVVQVELLVLVMDQVV